MANSIFAELKPIILLSDRTRHRSLEPRVASSKIIDRCLQLRRSLLALDTMSRTEDLLQ